MGVNKHLEHIEDLTLLEGKAGATRAIKVLKQVAEKLTGTGGPSVTITTKWDGAPAVVCGTDPADGKFFVGTKSVFNKQDAKICKTQSDIQRLYDGALASKLSYCLRYLPNVVREGVLQGDLLFTNDKANKTIDGKSYVTFRPNTLTYAATTDSDLGREIQAAVMGIVFHTEYSGPNLAQMSASFGVPPTKFHRSGQVWATTATYTDVGNVAALTGAEKQAFDGAIRRAEGSIKAAGTIFDDIRTGGRPLELDTEFKKFFNAFFRGGRQIAPVNVSYNQFLLHLAKEYNKAIAKNKTLAAQEKKAGKFLGAVDMIQARERQFKMLIASYMNIQMAKNLLVDKMNKVGGLNTFVETSDGYRVTNQEGFVAISGAQAVKLIDRLEFSMLNFTVPKKW